MVTNAQKTSDTNDTNIQKTQGLPDSGQKAIRNVVPRGWLKL